MKAVSPAYHISTGIPIYQVMRKVIVATMSELEGEKERK
jgi:hypothetical protein